MGVTKQLKPSGKRQDKEGSRKADRGFRPAPPADYPASVHFRN